VKVVFLGRQGCHHMAMQLNLLRDDELITTVMGLNSAAALVVEISMKISWIIANMCGRDDSPLFSSSRFFACFRR
jgi:hypothetical protein